MFRVTQCAWPFVLFAVVLLCFGTAVTGSVANTELLIIASPDVPLEQLNRETISDIYQGYRGKWNNGQKIKVVMLKEGNTHITFANSIVHLSPEKLKSLWKKVIFSGAGRPPKIVHSEEKCVQYIAATKGAIGYINAATKHDGVKVIEVQ